MRNSVSRRLAVGAEILKKEKGERQEAKKTKERQSIGLVFICLLD
jgi:hypothetical protein